MDDNFYKEIIEQSPIGYAYHKIICKDDGTPCDYQFIEVNSAFGDFTGLKGSEIIGKMISDILHGIGEDEFDWIQLYGKIAITGGKKEFEAYSENLKRWYRIVVYSPKKYYFVTLFINISKRKQIEEELKLNQRRLMDIIEFLPDATLAVDREKRVIIWNKAIEKMTGIPAAEMIGKGDYAYTIPFYGKKQPQLMDLIFQEDEVIKTRYGHFRKERDTLLAETFCPALYQGQGAWVSAKVSPLHDQAGNVIGAIESIRDINEQKLTEAGLRAKTAFLEAQANASFDGILVVNEKKQRILTNCRIAELFDVPQNILDDEDDALLLAYVATLSKKTEHFLDKVNYLYDHPSEISRDEIELKNGMVLDRYSAPVVDNEGKYYGRIWTFHDITERKKLETALAQEKKLLETTLISVGDGVISTDDQGNIMLLNRVAEYLTGWTQREAKGKPLEEIFNIHDEFTKEKCENIVEKVLVSGKTQELGNHTVLISKNGIARPIEDSAAPIVQEDGKIVGVVLVFRDFTEKKQKQDEIKFLSYHDQLTGVYNRRFYEEEIKRLDTEKNLPLTIVMGDVNGLKLINDSFGHAAGDELLKKVAEVLKKGCRPGDIIARLGGDEFILLLPKTDALETETIIRRIKVLAAKEKVGAIGISISFGYETKKNAQENVQEIFKNTEDQMYRHKVWESLSMRRKTIDLIMNTLYKKSNREMRHSKRVGEICKMIATQMNFNQDDINQMRIAGLMHDIGKIGIDEKILNKPQKLNEDERNEIKRHAEIGYRILSLVNEFSQIARFVLEHQEKWDGRGYPRGLKGEEISLQARIIAVADAYDAMMTDRPYCKALSKEEAVQEIRRCSSTQFDPYIVKIFLEKCVLNRCE
ncbi:MAG: putative diguanylate cyclase YegE [Candidatus Dichloromethanomonas elyunquensis]|nr:MAG: putative diguanylate cyclase YegE [Candidatus Dichloromethanomonas elyunquensis]